ncbi:unnamed protein product [Penicillium pancosmium]
MDSLYPRPQGLHTLSSDQVDLRPDSEVDIDIHHPRPICDDKNVWFFWHSGYETMHPYTKRNIRAWHRRFSKQGWVIRVLNLCPDSELNVSNFLDTSDPETFPRAFTEGTIIGHHAAQHTSDLVRFPLLVKYGGIYADVGLIMIGDLDRLWHATVGDSASPYEVISFKFDGVALTNYFLGSSRNNPFFRRCHQLFLKLWEGKTSTEGMWNSPLLKGVISLVMGLIDIEGKWNGPEYSAKSIYAMDYMVGSQLINEMTAWDGPRAFDLMSLSLPSNGERESEDQRKAREIVDACLSKSFAFKLAHGLILRVLGDTLGSLWRRHEGSDDVPRTYAHWLRSGVLKWAQNELPPAKEFGTFEPYKKGLLLEE